MRARSRSKREAASHGRAPRPAVLGAVSLCLAAVLAVSGCAADDLANDYYDGSGKGYITAGGIVTEFPETERLPAAEYQGPLDIGGTISSEDLLGEVVVLNFWYAGCPPCRVEAGDLEAVHQEFKDAGARFIGVNVRDQAATSLSFAETFGVSYPSVLDVNDADVQLAFAASVPPNSIPTTLVIDRQGRVAARILGMLESPSILRTLVQDALAEAG